MKTQNDEIMVIFDPSQMKSQLFKTIYSLMKQECEDVKIVTIPKKSKSSFPLQ